MIGSLGNCFLIFSATLINALLSQSCFIFFTLIDIFLRILDRFRCDTAYKVIPQIKFCFEHASVILRKFICFSTVIAAAQVIFILFLISLIQFCGVNNDLPPFQHPGIIKCFSTDHRISNIFLYFFQFLWVQSCQNSFSITP